MKKSIGILIILLLSLSTQAFASQTELFSPFSVEGNSVVENKEILSCKNPSTSIQNDDDQSTNGEPLCWYCTKYSYGGGENGVPKYKVCIEGFWSNICRTS